MTISATVFNDPACPWGYSANPSFRVLEWRYGAGIDWRLVVIGLREDVTGMAERGYDPVRSAARLSVFRDRYGMPFSLTPKSRLAATGRGCRAVVSARLVDPGSEWRVIRALQIANFTTPLLLDDDELIREALRRVPGVDADAVMDRIDDPEVEAAYQRDRAEARTAEGTPIAAQGKAANSDGSVRFTAPSIIFERGDRRLDAGGWQPGLAYDVCIANLDPTLRRRPAPDTPKPLLEYFADGLTTAEVAALLASGADEFPDLGAAETALAALVAQGKAVREAAGLDAIWRSTSAVQPADPARLAEVTG
ncbi:MAG: DsbA family protein [Actinomycetota bacterium]